MSTLKTALVALWREKEGLTVVEYAIAGGLVGATVILAFQALGLNVAGIIGNINTALAAAGG